MSNALVYLGNFLSLSLSHPLPLLPFFFFLGNTSLSIHLKYGQHQDRGEKEAALKFSLFIHLKKVYTFPTL